MQTCMARKARETEERAPDGVAVPETVMVHPSRLNPAPYNPRKIKPEKLESLKADIRAFGFVEKIVVQRHSPKYGEMIIIGGHQRLRAVREICIEDNVPLPELPCSILDLGDRPAMMLNAALNNPRGEFEHKLLGEMLEMIHDESPILPDEVTVMGFEDEEIGRYLKLSEPPVLLGDESAPDFARSVTLSLVFNDVRERDAVKAKLEERAQVEKKKTGEVVLGLLSEKKSKK